MKFTSRIELLSPAVFVTAFSYCFNRKKRFPVGGVMVKLLVPKPG